MDEERSPLIGVDIGGTSVKLGTITPSGSIVLERSVPIAKDQEATALFDALARGLREMSPDGFAHGVGLGVPGMFDRSEGRVILSPNLLWLNDVCVGVELAQRLDLPAERVLVENDANVAAYGEQWLGGARDAETVLVLTLGTGIGSGLILDGRLYRGAGSGAELGHVTVDPEGPPCGCGKRGCLETLASATAARRRAIERGLPGDDPGNLERLAAAARDDNGPERALLFEIGRDLGYGLSHAVTLLDLDTFVFAGGFAAALDTLESGIRSGLGEWGSGDRVSGIRLARATLGARAGWIGAARLTLP